jgi:hypothetical protein
LTTLRRISIAIAAGAASLAVCTPAATAANVLLGTPSPGMMIDNFMFPRSSTLSQGTLPGAVLTSPVDGAIVRWRFSGGDREATYSLRVLDLRGGLESLGAGRSAEVTPATGDLETFPAALPIRAGQTIGIDMEAGASINFRETDGAQLLFSQPPVAEGVPSPAAALATTELGFNAEVQPAPTVTGIAPETGPLEGGNPVVITGTEFRGVSAVHFGAVPAGFQVDSEGQITAVAPSNVTSTLVPISVTTVAGTASSAGTYAYVGTGGGGEGGSGGGGGGGGGNENGAGGVRCVVPKLRNLRLTTAKRRLRQSNCGLGRVRRKSGSSLATGRVLGQSPGRGRVLAPGAKVKLTLR